jgi:predicted nuclease of predicted toxin-antitoxin system
MRILLDEDLPRRFAALLAGHEVATVQESGVSTELGDSADRGTGH